MTEHFLIHLPRNERVCICAFVCHYFLKSCIAHCSQRLTHTLGGGSLILNTLSVFQMNTIGTVLFVEGTGSSMTATNIEVKDIFLEALYDSGISRNFNVMIATDGATASATTVTVTNCDGLDVSAVPLPTLPQMFSLLTPLAVVAKFLRSVFSAPTWEQLSP